MKVWIFLPAFNEGESLKSLIPKIKKIEDRLSQHDFSILILNDGSLDNTLEVLSSLKNIENIDIYNHKINRGLGETERDGFEYLASKCKDEDIIVRFDCDDTHEPEYIEALIAKINEGFDVVNTSRYQPGGYQVGVNWYRNLLSRAANIFMRLVFDIKGMKDYSCGFRAYRAKVIKDALYIYGNRFLQMRSFGFTSTLETIVKLDLIGCVFAEVPFGLRYDQKVTESKMVSSVTLIGYIAMAILYRLPFSGWRGWKKKFIAARLISTLEIREEFNSICNSKSVPSRFGM
jgi:dolichol-phosphate mannosyltransferase